MNIRAIPVFLVLVGLILGCGGAPKPTLVFAVGGAPNELDFWEQVCLEFEARSGITIELQRQPSNTDQRRQALVLALNSAQPDPDIFLVDVAWIAQFAASGWLTALDDRLGPAGIDPSVFFQSVVKSADTWDGRLIALPVYVDAGLLYYRTDLLKDAGATEPPRTWEELIALAKKVQAEQVQSDPAFAGYVWQGAQYEGLICHFLEVAVSAGGGLQNGQGRITVNTPENLKALTLLRDMILRDRISPENTFTEMKEEEVRRHFQDGHALFERNWPYAWALHQSEESAVKDKVGIAPLPSFPGQKPAATLGGWHAAVSAHSDNPEAAMKFLAFILSEEIQKRCSMELGWNPGRRDLYADPDLQASSPHLSRLAEVFENAVARPNIPSWPLVSERLQVHVNAAIAGKVSPEDALTAAQSEIDVLVAKYEDQ